MLDTRNAPLAEAGGVPFAQAALEWLLRRMLRAAGSPAIDFELWNGRHVSLPGAEPVATLRIADRRTLVRILGDPQLAVGDAYSEEKLEIEGDLVQFMREIDRAAARSWHARMAAPQVRSPPSRGDRTRGAARRNAQHHYDIGNEFYASWLGPTMAYTCAYYHADSDTLEQAQVAKFEHICRKLRLRPGESVVEAGCGWGSLALHMAAHHGVRVKAYNVARQQLEYAREECRRLGLQAQVEFIEDDYRNIRGRHDAFVSVGMLEHVGPEHYASLGRLARNALVRQGRGLVHSIGANRPSPVHPWIERRIFPGSYVPSVGEMMAVFESADLTVLDLENLRPHYALTLRDWLRRYEAAAGTVESRYGRRFMRMWRLYLAGSIAAFETGELQLFQVLFGTAADDRQPLTREYMYEE